MVGVRWTSRTAAAAIAAALLAREAIGCGAGAPRRPSQPVATPVLSKTQPKQRARIDFVSPSTIIPDLPADTASMGIDPDGSRRVLVMQMRILDHPDGAIERAGTLLPSGPGRLTSVELPARLGGGFAFVYSTESAAQMWRSAGWLAPLQPVLATHVPIYDVVPGLDRLYVRHELAGALYGIDLDRADYTDSGNLPLPARAGPAIFPDAWRGVVMVDLRGPLATFDAGASWFPLGIRSAVTSLARSGSSILVSTRSEQFLLNADGQLTSIGPGSGSAPAKPQPAASSAPEHPLGRRPMRLAIERGYPYESSLAIVAHGGNIIQFDLAKQSIVKIDRHVYPTSYIDCYAIALSQGIGFVCGQNHGGTTVFQYTPPATLKPVLHWAQPRAVFPSGNGALVARAPCPGHPASEGQAQYCVRDSSGSTREIRFQGDLGAERIAVLSDGTLAVVIAPRPATEARLVLMKGSQTVVKVLDFANVPRPVSELIHRGMWMNGVVEIEPQRLGVWVEAGGPIVGLKIDATGVVHAGPVQTLSSRPSPIVTSGRFGLVWTSSGKGRETTDGGMTWTEFDAPTSATPNIAETRSCSAVGCILGGWMRVGWGPTRDPSDLQPAKGPEVRYQPSRPPRGFALQCEATGRNSASAAAATGAPPQGPWSLTLGRVAAARWQPLGPLAPPALGKEEEGISGGRDYGDPRGGDFRYRAYAWGPKSSDWTRSGHWMIRFDDPYDAVSLPRSSWTVSSPWSDMSTAASALIVRNDACFDPEGRAGVIGWWTMNRQRKLAGFAAAEAPVMFYTAEPAALPQIASAVRVDQQWYLLSMLVNSESEVWVASPSGSTHKLRSYPRVAQEYSNQDSVVLVRRARGVGVGMLTQSRSSRGGPPEWIVLPLDPTTGEILDPVRLGFTDLSGATPPVCTPESEGWMIETSLTWPPSLRVGSQSFGAGIRARLRLDPGRVCVDALSARARFADIASAPHRPPGPAAGRIPVSVWDTEQNRKYELMCAPESQLPPGANQTQPQRRL
jgi:hypothetical protein